MVTQWGRRLRLDRPQARGLGERPAEPADVLAHAKADDPASLPRRAGAAKACALSGAID